MARKIKKLYRSGRNKVVAGICGGLAEYLGVDPTVIRLIWLLSFVIGGAGFVAYLFAWLIMPKNPKHRW